MSIPISTISLDTSIPIITQVSPHICISIYIHTVSIDIQSLSMFIHISICYIYCSHFLLAVPLVIVNIHVCMCVELAVTLYHLFLYIKVKSLT